MIESYQSDKKKETKSHSLTAQSGHILNYNRYYFLSTVEEERCHCFGFGIKG